ncbi:hypothetical protein KC669_01540, partial [Candidatus Dojkabacteria bacterium]|nr:hypothetical protein [Candidatus Dojkabacteria bacterium]
SEIKVLNIEGSQILPSSINIANRPLLQSELTNICKELGLKNRQVRRYLDIAANKENTITIIDETEDGDILYSTPQSDYREP